MKQTKNAARVCGGCTACCKPMAVPEVGKHDADWCHHCEQGRGCTIYVQRPVACRLYICSWLRGLGEDNDRPDRLGVLVDSHTKRTLKNGRTVNILTLWELLPNALKNVHLQSMAQRHKETGGVLVYKTPHQDNRGYTTTIQFLHCHFSSEETVGLRALKL